MAAWQRWTYVGISTDMTKFKWRLSPPFGVGGWTYDVNTISLVVSIISLMLTVVLAIFGVLVKSEVQQLRTARLFTITSPANGSTVEPAEFFSGTTPFPDLKHYVVVHPNTGSEDWVQKRASVYRTGTWTGPAIIGDSSSAGVIFTVRCLATKKELPPGRLVDIPEDAQFSSAVSVRRR